MDDINRIKFVLVENKRINRRLAEEIGKEPCCRYANSSHPDL